MAKRPSADAGKIKAAVDSLLGCFAAAEAAFKDLQSVDLRFAGLSDVNAQPFQQKLQNRIVTTALALQRLEDATRRLLKRLGQDVKAFENSLASSVSIRVTGRLANSWKHGLGGQRKNATLLNGVLSVHRNDGWKDEAGAERVHVLGMMITDATEGAFSSQDLLAQCVKDWGTLLEPVVPAARDWVKRVAPTPSGPVVKAIPNLKPAVPLCATVVFKIPDEFRDLLASEAKRRSESA